MPSRGLNCFEEMNGFGLIELMVAIFILAFGLLATGQLVYSSLGLNSLARAKSTAEWTAKSTMESLADLYRRNPEAEELKPGSHPPVFSQIINPVNKSVLNSYKTTWFIEEITDPRPDKVLAGRYVSVQVAPVQQEESKKPHAFQNKILTVNTIFSRYAQ